LYHTVVSLLYSIATEVLPLGTQTTPEVGIVHPELEVEGLIRIVAKAEVYIVIGEGRSRPEGYRAVDIGEDVEGVAVTLRDGKRAMCHEPEEQVTELAEPPSNPLADLSLMQY